VFCANCRRLAGEFGGGAKIRDFAATSGTHDDEDGGDDVGGEKAWGLCCFFWQWRRLRWRWSSSSSNAVLKLKLKESSSSKEIE